MRVLVVDDNEDIALLLRLALRSHQIDVSSEAGGLQALRFLETTKVDVVILDVQMPDMDGWETLKQLRSRPGSAYLPVILCTVKGRPIDAHRGWKAGCDGYVTKPFDIPELVATIRAIYARSPAERDIFRRAELARAKERMDEAESADRVG